MPLIGWDTYDINKFSDIENMMQCVGRLFSFNELFAHTDSDSLFDMNVPYIRNSVFKKDVTNLVYDRFGKSIKQIGVYKVYLLEYAVEFISNKDDLFVSTNYSLIKDIVNELVKTNIADGVICYANDVLNMKYIICDNGSELNKAKEKYDLNEFVDGLFLGDQSKTSPLDHFYNFSGKYIIAPSARNPIVFYRLDELEEVYSFRGKNNVGLFVMFWYCMGIVFLLNVAISSLIGRLEESRWYLSNVFDSYEEELCYLQRNILNQNKEVSQNIRGIQNYVKYLLTYTSEESYNRIMETYGTYPKLDIISQYLQVISSNKEMYDYDYDDIRKKVKEDLKNLSNTLQTFFKDVDELKKEWLDMHTNITINNKFLINIAIDVLVLFITLLQIIRRI